MLAHREYFATWEVLHFDSGSTRQIVNTVSLDHPLKLLAERINTQEQRWSLLWYTKLDDNVSDRTLSDLKSKLENDNWYIFNN